MSWKVLRRMQHENQRIESVSRFYCESAKLLGLLVDLIGIEPMTSSMPCYECTQKLLTMRHLRAGKTGKTGVIGAICCQNAAKIISGRSGCTVGGQLD